MLALNKIDELQQTFHKIPEERKELLKSLEDYISNKIKEGNEISFTFICTHNSRRSHMAQIWAQTSAEYYGIPNVNCYSGGTEAMAFNFRAVEAVKKAGFKIIKLDESDNPIYFVYYSDDKEALKCFSKVYNDPSNPQNDYAAIMTCSDADENCPIVFGAEARFPIRYNDPKEFDGTELEEKKYQERFDQIGTEMLFAFSNINRK